MALCCPDGVALFSKLCLPIYSEGDVMNTSKEELIWDMTGVIIDAVENNKFKPVILSMISSLAVQKNCGSYRYSVNWHQLIKKQKNI